MVGLERLELSTSRLSSARSNQLSYKPKSGRTAKRPCKRTCPCKKEKRRRRHPAKCILIWMLLFQYRSRYDRSHEGLNLRKEVIQPQVPLRLPCYDFTPVAEPTVVSCPLAVSALPSGKPNSHGVTGGVYKARERIHRSMLICDY